MHYISNASSHPPFQRSMCLFSLNWCIMNVEINSLNCKMTNDSQTRFMINSESFQIMIKFILKMVKWNKHMFKWTEFNDAMKAELSSFQLLKVWHWSDLVRITEDRLHSDNIQQTRAWFRFGLTTWRFAVQCSNCCTIEVALICQWLKH